MNYCFNCEKPTRNKFCSIICQKDYEYKKYIQEWKAGKVSGLTCEYQISMHIKNYLIKHQFACFSKSYALSHNGRKSTI